MLLLWSLCLVFFGEAGRGASLDPRAVSRFQLALPVPVEAPRRGSAVRLVARAGEQQMLPPPFPPTKTYLLGPPFSSPGPLLSLRQKETQVTYVNQMGAPHLLHHCIDPSIGWADPWRNGSLLAPAPWSPHLHGAAPSSACDGTPGQWFTQDLEATGPYFRSSTCRYGAAPPGAVFFGHDHSHGLTRLSVYAGMVFPVVAKKLDSMSGTLCLQIYPSLLLRFPSMYCKNTASIRNQSYTHHVLAQ